MCDERVSHAGTVHVKVRESRGPTGSGGAASSTVMNSVFENGERFLDYGIRALDVMDNANDGLTH